MKFLRTLWAPLFSALLLAGCTYGSTNVRVSGANPQQPQFFAPGGGPFGLLHACVEQIRVSEQNETGGAWSVVWSASSKGPCAPSKTITYGVDPPDFYDVIPAQHLNPGRLHDVEVSGDGSSGVAKFRWTSTGYVTASAR